MNRAKYCTFQCTGGDVFNLINRFKIHSIMQNETSQINDKISEIIEKLEDLVLAKNTTYGNSLQNPVRVFSRATSVESICARIDDKLSRISAVGVNDDTIDTIYDLMGYYVHLLIALEREI